MKGDQVEKRKLLVDNEELEGLISISEYDIAEGVEQVAGTDRTVPVKNGVTVIPEITCIFKNKRSSKTMKFLQDWKYKNETHDCVMIRTDGAGREISRELWPNVECSKVNGGGYDAASPVTSVTNVILLPENIIPIDPEG